MTTRCPSEFPAGYAEDEAQDFADISACIGAIDCHLRPDPDGSHIALHLALAPGYAIELLRGLPYVVGPGDTWAKVILPTGARLLCTETRVP